MSASGVGFGVTVSPSRWAAADVLRWIACIGMHVRFCKTAVSLQYPLPADVHSDADVPAEKASVQSRTLIKVMAQLLR
jgi:hypothetical protein